MSFLFRAPSHSCGAVPDARTAKSFSVRTGRMEDTLAAPGSLEPSRTEPSKEFLAAKHFLRSEVQAAHTAVSALDQYVHQLNSFEEKAMELLEEAHRALSRVEHAVASAAAPEFIVVACEVKVACHRGLHLFRKYGRYRYFGKLIAFATSSSTTAKFDAVIARLTSIMPLDGLGLSMSAEGGLTGNGSRAFNGSPTPNATALHLKGQSDSTPSDSACSTSRQAAADSPDAKTATPTAEVLANMMKGNCGNTSAQRGTSLTATATAAATAADGAAVMVRAGAHDKVAAVSFVQPLESLSAAACVWWAEGDKLEFYSSVTQSTTSFAAPQTQALGFITAVTLDSAGNVWAGTSRGSVIMRQRTNWEQTLVDRAFSSRVRCLAADAESDVLWAGDESGRLAVLRYNEVTDKVDCTAIILPGRRNAVMSLGGLRGRTIPAMTDGLKPKPRSFLQMRRTTSGRYYSPNAAPPPEGPIRTMMVRDDRAWVAGGRAEPWLAVFDAVQGKQLDAYMCSSYGSCTAMASLLTAAALAEQAAATAAAARTSSTAAGTASVHSLAAAGSNGSLAGSLIASILLEDGIAEDPRSSWRLITGHENGQLLIWEAAVDSLHPLVKVGEAGASPVRAVAALEQQGLVAVAHSSGELVLFNRPVRDEDWMLSCAPAPQAGNSTLGTLAVKHQAHCGLDGAGASRRPSGSSRALSHIAHAAAASATMAAAAVALRHSTVPCPLTTIKPRKAVLCSHRCSLAAAAACGYGVVTASSLGAIKLWTGEALAKEAEKLGMPTVKPQLLLVPSESSSPTRCSTGGGATSRLASTAAGDNCSRSAQMPQEQGSRRTTAEDCLQLQPRRSHSPKPSYGQQDLQVQPAPAAHTVQRSAAAAPQEQHLLAQHVKQRSPPWPTQQPPNGQRSSENSCVPESISGVLVSDQSQPAHVSNVTLDSTIQDSRQHDLADCSVPASIPGQEWMGQQANNSLQGRPGSLLEQPPGTQMPSGSIGSAAEVASGSLGVDMRQGSSGDCSYTGSPELGSDAAGAMLRDRRKSERRLSRGAQMRWSSCQMVSNSELRLLSQIGNGAYGKVWLAEWMGTQVAVKELVWFQDRTKDRSPNKMEPATDALAAFDESDSDDSLEEEVQRELKDLMDEVFLLGSLTHPCISRFCALCLDPPMIVMQYYSHGSMYELLKRGKKGDRRSLQELTWSKRLEMLRDVASGMVFLHSRRPPVVHGDLRSPNLLLDYTVDRDRGRYHVRIADFGLARMLGAASSIPVSKVTNPRWSAPEVIRSSSLSRCADVFSFAVVMWELLTWQQPYEEMMSVQVLFNVVQQARPEIPSFSELPGMPGSQLPRYNALMETCWQEDPAARPSFEDVVKSLDEMRAVDCVKQARTGTGSGRTSYLSDAGTPSCGTPINCGTPAGSGFFADSSVSSSYMGSPASSAANSAGPAAAALAAAAARLPNTPQSFGIGSVSSSRSGSPQPTPHTAGHHTGSPADSAASSPDPAQACMTVAANASVTAAGPSGTISAWRVAAQSDPGTPPAAAGCHSSGYDKRLQLAGVGSAPNTGIAFEHAQQQQQPTASPGGSPGNSGNSSPGSFGGFAEPSFAAQLTGAAGGSSSLPAKMMQLPVARTPSRLGPIRTGGTLAAAGSRDGAGAAPAAALPLTGPPHVSGLPPLYPFTSDLGSSSTGPASSFNMAPDQSPPVLQHHTGQAGYSPFPANAGPPSHSFDAEAEVVAVLSGAAGSPRAGPPVPRPVSPFSAVQSEAEDEPLFGQISPAVSRPSSPFANVQGGQLWTQQQRQRPTSSWPVQATNAVGLQESAAQQRPADSPRVSPFSSVGTAAVDGSTVSHLLMEMRAIYAAAGDNAAEPISSAGNGQ